MAEIGTKSVHEGGGRHHPVRNEGGAGKIVPLHFWTVWSLLNPKLQKINFSTKNPTGANFMT